MNKQQLEEKFDEQFSFSDPNRPFLSPREEDILWMCKRGFSLEEIGERYNLSGSMIHFIKDKAEKRVKNVMSMKQFIFQAIEDTLKEVIDEIDDLKPDVNNMKHDLQCKCDFEKMNILNDSKEHLTKKIKQLGYNI